MLPSALPPATIIPTSCAKCAMDTWRKNSFKLKIIITFAGKSFFKSYFWCSKFCPLTLTILCVGTLFVERIRPYMTNTQVAALPKSYWKSLSIPERSEIFQTFDYTVWETGADKVAEKQLPRRKKG
jgi:hypothetical protein